MQTTPYISGLNKPHNFDNLCVKQLNINNMNRICLIEAEWNNYNGFMFSILNLDLNKPNIDSSLFGLNISSYYFYLSLMFFTIKVFDKTD